MARRDDSRDAANRIRAMLEVILQTMPVAADQEQKEQIEWIEQAVNTALVSIKQYVRLRIKMEGGAA